MGEDQRRPLPRTEGRGVMVETIILFAYGAGVIYFGIRIIAND
jgi:hypothetical protein